MTSLVLEGGGFRGIYSAGVLDALLDLNVTFPYVIGVSAGISNGYSYVSGQKGRNWLIAERYYNDKRYCGYRNFLTSRSMFGMDFMFNRVPNELLPYDYEALNRYPGRVLAGATHAVTGKAVYFDQQDNDKDNTILRASCSIPFIFPAVTFCGEKYYDGGVADPIPVAQAMADGCTKHLIVLTQPLGYHKEPSKTNIKGAKLLKRRYPGIADVMVHRHEIYNRQLALCAELEQKGDAIVLRPAADKVVPRFERNVPKLRALYENGYEDVMDRKSSIIALASCSTL